MIDLRSSCLNGFEWPEELLHCRIDSDILRESINYEAFTSLVKTFNTKQDIIITLLSIEYLDVAKIWLSYLNRIYIKQYIVIAADNETELFLASMNIPYVRIRINKGIIQNEKYRSRTGFTAKGLAITAFKFPIVKFILELGYNVLLMDIDAILLEDLANKHFLDFDIVFQRVLYFPKTIATIWGFAICSGFVWFRSNRKTIELISKAISIQQIVYSDQIALNVAVLDEGPLWEKAYVDSFTQSESNQIEASRFFIENSTKYINGISSSFLKLRALPATSFYRNEIVPLNISDVIVFHPNTPKSGIQKFEVFKKYSIE